MAKPGPMRVAWVGHETLCDMNNHRPCYSGEVLDFQLLPIINILPDPTHDPGWHIYDLQPCDRVSFRWGDGTGMEWRGGFIRHIFPSVGQYRVEATIDNPLGSITLADTVYVVADPNEHRSPPPPRHRSVRHR